MIKLAKKNETESIEMRAAYAEALIKATDKNSRVVDLEADLMGAMGTGAYKKAYPNNLIQVGIAEQAMVSIAGGLASVGFVPFANTFACFMSRRACDQVYMSAGYARLNVKLVGADPGISGAFNGGTHQGMEDVAIFRPIPNITILEPCDSTQMKWAVETAATTEGLFYIRMHRQAGVKVYEEDSTFEIGKGVELTEGNDVTIFTAGVLMIGEALKAAEALKAEGIGVRVVDLFSIKPIDEELIVKCAKETGAVLVAENHFDIGGLNSAVSEVLVKNGVNVRYDNLGVKGCYGEVGAVDYLIERFELTDKHMIKAAKALVAAK
jgi:transketolase